MAWNPTPATPTAALVRAVPDTLADGQVTFIERQPIDLAVAVRQHEEYCATLTALSLDLVQVPPAPDLPDSVFVEDTVVVVGSTGIVTLPGAATRRPEVEVLPEVLTGRGLAVQRLADPARLDGGDVLQVGETVYVGRSQRTNSAAHSQLAALLAPLGRRLVPVSVHGCLHLKSGVTALPDGALLAVPDWVDTTAFDGHEVVDAPEPSGADVLLVGSTVVLSASAPRTAALVAARGFDVRTVQIGEFEKVEAGPTCMSVLL